MNPLVAPEAHARPHRTALSVNVNKIALLRNTRHLGIPDVVALSRLALEAALRARGINAKIVNAGVSGDTTADGLGRLDFTLNSQPRKPDLVILCLGGNDMLRALPASESKANVNAILGKLEARKVPTLVMGMLAAPNLGPDYAGQFNPIFPTATRSHHARLVPFFLSAVIDHPELRQADHIHPTAKGVEALVTATVDQVAAALGEGGKVG